MAGRGLGRGFDSLIPTDIVENDFDITASQDAKESQLIELDLSLIVPDEDQPRKDFSEEALAALANSIREHGVLQPIVVVKDGVKYKIVAGERRYRASKLAGLEKIPAIIRTLDAQNRLELSIIENAQREDLNAIEMATAYAKLKNQFNLSQSEIAVRVGKSESSIVNTMRLLNLPDEVKHAMIEHNLTEGVMRPLISADAELVKKVLPLIIEEGWSARQVERYIAEHKKRSSAKIVKENVFLRQEEDLSAKYGARVRVRGRTLTLACKNDEELKRLIDRLSD
ncbi:ParB/RepB/Spo0J family partition protein [Candidatus Saccharibacteria bacterium]|jgi:parBc, parB-like nuclease domain|nr:ParB/RepB/Spo0J family partition protein [Candidatus Saccharibacteria bacterium]MBB1532445.1 ParB/RepB/Spo0J family partition protein [Candidatus Saccharibacteria bacterium]